MICTTILIIQSPTTGKFLLRQTNDIWQFFYTKENKDWIDLAHADVESRKAFSETGIWFSVPGTGRLVHAVHFWADENHAIEEYIKEHNCQWFSMFDFPERTHESIEKIFKLTWFENHILNPFGI